MEVFSIFATLSLVDLVSGPLDRIRGAMGGVNASVASLGQRMGNLALAMAPVPVCELAKAWGRRRAPRKPGRAAPWEREKAAR